MAATDALIKPDMQAVLARTHISINLHGFLLPVFEAISNAMDGIQRQYADEAPVRGRVKVNFQNTNDPRSVLIGITDNGIGLDADNYNSFKTPFSGYKLSQRGRGFGRFIAFKVFSRVMYSSRYMAERESVRAFRFDIKQEREFVFFDGEPDFKGIGLRVEYNQPLPMWNDLIKSMRQKEILEAIGSHFLPYFLYRWLPKITVQFDSGPEEDITSYFKSMFVQYESGSFDIEIDSSAEKLDYSLVRVAKGSTFKNHCLLLSAADRIVGFPRDLSNKIGNSYFADENENKFVVIAVVRGDAFEKRLNDARTSIDVPPKTIETIVSIVSDLIQSKEQDQIDKIKSSQSTEVGGALKENPILRFGLKGRTVQEYVRSKPNNWGAEEFVSDLAVERYRATTDLTKQIAAAAGSPENYDEKIKDIVKKVDAGKKDALAEYVIHRKNIISLVDATQKFKDDGKRSTEDEVHELMFRRFSDSVKTGYFEHNLWMIDDALAFLPYVSSDRAMHGKGRKAGDKVTDLVFFDDSLILGDTDGTTLTIVEFKKPSRDDYSFGNIKLDPVLQVIETLEKATAAGGITKTDGTRIHFNGVIRRFAFIIADITPPLVSVLRRHDFKNDWNPSIYVRYRENEKIFIQAFGFNTLIEMARKRNQAFFSVLLDE